MENICLRLDSSLSKQIEKDMKEFKYSTKTEFIREAIRSKLRELDEQRDKKKAWNNLIAARGSLKGKSRFKSDEEWHDWRSNEGSKELEKELFKKFGLKP
ncbi:ribbon-helix-helix domain-containing protein [Candidatus Micrarchaeota archaeon]|nr:ribbon-helix-helix domain-containing protein [Candidatus Micrarchaeota archaeon]MBU2475905.1 ribbon-helix-helix domain-containing protein [Candidatus Micrarchaeota archaeon]